MLRKIRRRLAALLCTMAVFIGCMGDIAASAFNFTPVKQEKDAEGNYIKLELYSDSAYMINMDTGDVLIDIKSTKQRVPASLTKIMTALVLLDEFDGEKYDLEHTYYSAPPEYFDGLWDMGASIADIYADEKINCYDLLAALLIPSACDAANVIAYGMCGSIDKFCDRMNELADRIGMEDSHFSCAHGLSGDNNYSTCQDIAKACMYALDNYDIFRDLVEKSYYYMTPTDFHPEDNWRVNSTNELLDPTSGYYYSYCMGIKTGTLDQAGRCFASYAVQDGHRYLIVTMGAPLEKQEKDYQKGIEKPDSVFAYDDVYYNFVDHINLYNWAFTYLSEREIVDPNSEVREAKVEFGDKGRDYVTLKPQSGCRVTFPSYIEDKEIEREITVYDNVVAPVKKGDELGRIKISYQGIQIADIPLIATDSVARSRTEELKAVAKSFPRSRSYKVVVGLCIFGIVLYTVIYILWVQNKYMKKR